MSAEEVLKPRPLARPVCGGKPSDVVLAESLQASTRRIGSFGPRMLPGVTIQLFPNLFYALGRGKGLSVTASSSQGTLRPLRYLM